MYLPITMSISEQLKICKVNAILTRFINQSKIITPANSFVRVIMFIPMYA